MASRISYQKKNSAGTRYETTPSLKRRIKHVSGYKCKDIIPLEGNLASFTADGIEYIYTKSVYFSVDGFGYSTDFETVTRAPEYDSPARKQERAKREALHCENLAHKFMRAARDARDEAKAARDQHDKPAADAAAAMAEKYAQKAEKYASDAKSAAAVAASEKSAEFAAAAAKHAEVARAWANDAANMAADTAAHIEPEPEPEPSEKAAKDAREYASMCAFISMSCALASIRAILDNDVSGAEHAARAAQNNADRAADAARHTNESAPDSMTARSAREYAAHAQTGADIAARVIHDLTRPSVEDLAAKYSNQYLIWSE